MNLVFGVDIYHIRKVFLLKGIYSIGLYYYILHCTSLMGSLKGILWFRGVFDCVQMILYYDWCKSNVLSTGTFIHRGQWRHEKFSDDVHDPQCRESNWITQTLKHWWIVNVRSLFKNIAPKGKNTHNHNVHNLPSPKLTAIVPENMPKPKMRLVFQPSIFRCQPVSCRECRLQLSDVCVKNHGFCDAFFDIWHVSNATLWLQPWYNFWMWRYFHGKNPGDLAVLGVWNRDMPRFKLFFWGFGRRHVRMMLGHRQIS